MKKITLLILLLIIFNSCLATPKGSVSIDLGIGIEVSADHGLGFLVGETATYEITVVNNSFITAQQIVVNDPLPASVQFESDDCGGSIVGNEWIWTLSENLGQNETSSCLLTVLVQQSGQTLNAVSVTTTEPGVDDPELLNNSAEVAFDAGVKEADLAIGLNIEAIDGSDIFLDDQAVLIIQMTNNGPHGVEQSLVSAELPSGVEVISNNCNASVIGDSITWVIDQILFSGESLTCEFVLLLNETGEKSLNALVELNDLDVNEIEFANNADVVNFEVLGVPGGQVTAVPTLSQIMKWMMVILLICFGLITLKTKKDKNMIQNKM